MAKHIQTIRRQQPTNCLSVFDHFASLTIKGLSIHIAIQVYCVQLYFSEKKRRFLILSFVIELKPVLIFLTSHFLYLNIHLHLLPIAVFKYN